jgi:hypothetical protein
MGDSWAIQTLSCPVVDLLRETNSDLSGSLSFWVSGSLGLWVSGSLGLWVFGSLGPAPPPVKL